MMKRIKTKLKHDGDNNNNADENNNARWDFDGKQKLIIRFL